MKYKIFNDRKYYLNNGRWHRTIKLLTRLSHDVWYFFYPNDPILKNDVIHHKNGDSSDDRIENLQKMKRGEHTSLHVNNMSDETKQKISKAIMGVKNPNFGRHLSDETKQKISKSNIKVETKKYITFCKRCNKDTEHYVSGCNCVICSCK